MTIKIRLSSQTLLLVETLLRDLSGGRYGYDLSRETGLKSGTLYPILMRLSDLKLVDSQWEATEPGRPPRHVYRLTAEGAKWAREITAPKRRTQPFGRAAEGSTQ